MYSGHSRRNLDGAEYIRRAKYIKGSCEVYTSKSAALSTAGRGKDMRQALAGAG